VTEQKEKPVRRGLDSKAVKTFLTLVAAFLTFAGPTYVVYTFARVLNVDYAVSMVTGIVLFVVGLLLIWFLIRKKAITE
jgi:membrane protein DedA with SNARE-associated domain